jgi:predicted dehydrogenase
MIITVLGLGSIGLRHVTNLMKTGHKVYGIDPDPTKTNPHRQSGSFEVTTGALRRLWLNASNAVIIATPTHQHLNDLVEIARLDDPPHVFVEKPIADANVYWSVGQFDEKNKIVFVGNNLRFHNVVKQVKEWLPSIGTIRSATFTCHQQTDKPTYLRDGVTLNSGAHEVDLALYLLGPAKLVSADINADDSLSMLQLRHENGFRSLVSLSYHGASHRRFTIAGEYGHIFADLEARTCRLTTDKPITHSTNYVAVDSWDENYIEEMQAFLDRMTGHDTLGATGYDGLATLEILLAAKEKSHQ